MTRLAILAPLCIPAGGTPRDHNGGQSSQNDDGDGCTPSTRSIAADDSRLGFSSNDVFALLGEHLPVEVRWNEITQGDAVTDITVALTSAGLPEVAEAVDDMSGCVDTAPWGSPGSTSRSVWPFLSARAASQHGAALGRRPR